jgi:hypothetical protein
MASTQNILLIFHVEHYCDLYINEKKPFKESRLYTVVPKPIEITREQYINGLTIDTNIGTFNGKWIDGKWINVSDNSISMLNHTCEHCTSNTCTINITFQRHSNTTFEHHTFHNMNFDNDNYEWFDNLCGNITVNLLRGG